jgi:hypothetical protein
MTPRSIQEILDHADSLQRAFEALTPAADDEIPLEEYLLERAVIQRAEGERALAEAVAAARASGVTWTRIGQALGTSPQAVQQRYGPLVELG